MNVAYQCRKCEQPVTRELSPAAAELICPACGEVSPWPAEALREGQSNNGGQLSSCLVCGCPELFVRKDFPQRLGVGIVVVGLVASSVALAFHQRFISYGILFATALIDLVLYFAVKNMLQCYRCQAIYRGLSGLDEFEPFNLETHEKYRQQAIRLAESRNRK